MENFIIVIGSCW